MNENVGFLYPSGIASGKLGTKKNINLYELSFQKLGALQIQEELPESIFAGTKLIIGIVDVDIL